MEPADAGDDVAGELSDGHVVVVHGAVVELAAIGDSGLEARDALLKREESLVRLELWITLGEREQLAELPAKLALGLAECGSVRRLARAKDRSPRREHFVER